MSRRPALLLVLPRADGHGLRSRRHRPAVHTCHQLPTSRAAVAAATPANPTAAAARAAGALSAAFGLAPAALAQPARAATAAAALAAARDSAADTTAAGDASPKLARLLWPADRLVVLRYGGGAAAAAAVLAPHPPPRQAQALRQGCRPRPWRCVDANRVSFPPHRHDDDVCAWR